MITFITLIAPRMSYLCVGEVKLIVVTLCTVLNLCFFFCVRHRINSRQMAYFIRWHKMFTIIINATTTTQSACMCNNGVEHSAVELIEIGQYDAFLVR